MLLMLMLVMPPCLIGSHPIWHRDTICENGRGVVGVKPLQIMGWTQRSRVLWLAKPSKEATNCVGPGVSSGVLRSWLHPIQHSLVARRVGAGWPRLNRLVGVWPVGVILVTLVLPQNADLGVST